MECWLEGKDSDLTCQLNKCPVYKELQELLSKVHRKLIENPTNEVKPEEKRILNLTDTVKSSVG